MRGIETLEFEGCVGYRFVVLFGYDIPSFDGLLGMAVCDFLYV